LGTRAFFFSIFLSFSVSVPNQFLTPSLRVFFLLITPVLPSSLRCGIFPFSFPGHVALAVPFSPAPNCARVFFFPGVLRYFFFPLLPFLFFFVPLAHECFLINVSVGRSSDFVLPVSSPLFCKGRTQLSPFAPLPWGSLPIFLSSCSHFSFLPRTIIPHFLPLYAPIVPPDEIPQLFVTIRRTTLLGWPPNSVDCHTILPPWDCFMR